MLERLLTETELRFVVLDPNSDYVRLTAVRSGVGGEVAARYRVAARQIEPVEPRPLEPNPCT